MHCRQKKGQAVQDYYHTTAKQRLGSLDALKYDHIVYGLTDGLLQEMKITEATLQFFTPPRGLQKHNMWKAFPGGSVRKVEVLTTTKSQASHPLFGGVSEVNTVLFAIATELKILPTEFR